jgi:hypothetical protein
MPPAAVSCQAPAIAQGCGGGVLISDARSQVAPTLDYDVQAIQLNAELGDHPCGCPRQTRPQQNDTPQLSSYLGRLGSENGLPYESFLSLPKTINAPTIAVITALTERPARSLMAALADVRDHKSLRRPLLARAYPPLEKACASLSSVAGSEK